MAFKEIREWLSEYKSLNQEEFHTYASTIRNREDLYNAISALFEGDLSNEFVEPVCHQIFEFFKASHIELRRFTLDLMPAMIYTYLTCISRGEKREVVREDGKPKADIFTIPTMAVPSIYHEPPSLATLALTESSLLRYHSDEPITVAMGPLPQVDTINAQNRMSVLKYILRVYIADIKNLQPRSHKTLCKVCARIAKQGFDHIDDIGVALVTIDLNDSMSSTSSRSSRRSVKFNSASEPRIRFDSDFLVECLTGLYFTMFNGQPHLSIEALNFIHKRACFERFSDVLLVTNAIRNSLQYNPSGQPQDGPMGLSVALSPYQRDEKLSKHAITNASFRGKRLPEDIPVLDEDYFSVDESPKQNHRIEINVIDHSVSQTEVKELAPDTAKNLHKRKQSSIKDKIVSFAKWRSTSFDKKDIEVVNSENLSQTENPPHYDEIVESDHSTTVSESKMKSSSGPSKLQQLSHPLKSIMKKGSDRSAEKPEKAKVHRKESDSQKQQKSSGKYERDRSERDSTSDTNSPRSPKNVASPFTNGTTSNGDIADPSYIQVQVVEGSSGKRTNVDNVEMESMSSQSSSTAYDKYHDSSSSMVANHVPDGSLAAHLKEKLTKSHSKEQRLLSTGGIEMHSSSSSKESLNTHL